MRPLEWDILDPSLHLEGASVRACVDALDRSDAHPVPPGQLNLAFVDLATCQQLHASFFGDPEPTDVMTFPGDAEDGMAGEIAICPSVAFTEASQRSLSFQGELTLYLVHAWLHLAGMEDASSSGKWAMREAEADLMDRLRRDGCILRASWLP